MIRIASHSEAGGHPKNEDYFAVEPLPAGQDGFLCALADGQGGHAGGARASELACRTCVEMASTGRRDFGLSPADLSDVLRKADDAVSQDPAAGYATLVVFGVTPGCVFGASCGDSAAILGSPNRRRRTVILTQRQSKNPPVGSGEATGTPFFVRLDSRWTILAMSDGVWKYAGWDHILNLDFGCRVEEIVPEILAKARLPNGGLQDDFTLVAFQQAPECEAASSNKEC